MNELLTACLLGLALYLSKPLPKVAGKQSKKIQKEKKHPNSKNIADTRDVVELLILTIASGMTIPKAISTTADNSESELASKLGLAIKSHNLGGSLEQELLKIAQLDRYWRLIIRQLQQSWEQGSTILENLIELNEYFIDLERAQILKKVRSAGVRSVLPLGACFLPAFMLVVVVPLVASLVNF